MNGNQALETPEISAQLAKHNSSSDPKCFRLTDVPPAWSKDDLLNYVRKSDPSLDHLEARVSLYPSCCDKASQVALLDLKKCPEFFQRIGPGETTYLTIHDEISHETVVLSMDCHFYDLTPLNTPEGDIVADIVAVTGLAGHAFGSWRHRGSRQMWLQDFLPRDFKNVRIMSYGYNSDLRSDSNNGILDYRRNLVQQLENARCSAEEKHRPIIFVGHSLGGILILQALLQSNSKLVHKPILDSTCAIFFFGTPHQGLRTTELEAMVNDLSGGAETSRLRLLMQLRENSEFWDAQRDALDEIWSGRKIISFYEVEKTRVVQKSAAQTYQRTGDLVEMVKKVSAQLYIPGEHRLPVERNHRDLVKFPIRGDSTYQSVVYYMKQCLDELFQENPSGPQENLIAALNAPDIASFRRNVEDAANGTFNWFLTEPVFNSWISAKNHSFLLIRGTPGQGKTVLSKFLLGHLENQNTHVQNSLVIYFFCSDRDDKYQTVNSILRSLITQLLPGSRVPREILSSYQQSLTKSRDSTDTLWDLFEAVLKDSGPRKIYCVLDGLDEIEKDSDDGKQRTKLLNRLKTLFTSEGVTRPRYPLLKFLGTSRPMQAILDPLDGSTCFDLKAHLEDLRIFVKERVSALPARFPKELRKEAERLLLKKVERTFLWVSIVVKRLQKIGLPTVHVLKATIDRSSTDLEALYHDIFRQITDFAEMEQRLVVWVVYGKRPLTLRELEAALATQIDSKNEESTKDHKITLTSETLTSVLGVILETTADGAVYLIHQSAKEFLLNSNLLKAVPSTLGHNLRPDVYISQICMTYLNFEDFRISKPPIEELKRRYPLLDYAARYWHGHIRETWKIPWISSSR